MEIKEINKIIQSEDKDEKSKSVKCICINYGDFLADCEGFVQKRYHDFKCNPKHQFEKKADTILENAIHEKNFMPDLFLIRLNRKQSACNSQIDFVFELLDKSFLETDPIRKSEISEETLNLCSACTTAETVGGANTTVEAVLQSRACPCSADEPLGI